jgi:hypothetical protein
LEVNVPVQTVPPVTRAEPPSKENQKKNPKKKNPEKESLPLPIIDAFSDDSDDEQPYSSSVEEGEVYIRGKMCEKRKVAAREELPHGREPVSNPLTLEERILRKETRVQRRRETRAHNLKMIRLLMRGVAKKLHFHCHIKHFRSNLHRYIDFLFDEPRHRGFAHGLNEEHLSVEGLNPIASAPVPMETKSLPSDLPPTENSMEDALPFANLKIDVDPKGDGTNYLTEIMVKIDKRSYRVIADSQATSSGVNLKVVQELDLVNFYVAHRLPVPHVLWPCEKGARHSFSGSENWPNLDHHSHGGHA